MAEWMEEWKRTDWFPGSTIPDNLFEDNIEDGEQTEDMEDDTSSAPEWSIDSDSEHEL